MKFGTKPKMTLGDLDTPAQVEEKTFNFQEEFLLLDDQVGRTDAHKKVLEKLHVSFNPFVWLAVATRYFLWWRNMPLLRIILKEQPIYRYRLVTHKKDRFDLGGQSLVASSSTRIHMFDTEVDPMDVIPLLPPLGTPIWFPSEGAYLPLIHFECWALDVGDIFPEPWKLKELLYHDDVKRT